jgi:hypothetical protein
MIYDGLTDRRVGVLPALGIDVKVPQLPDMNGKSG